MERIQSAIEKARQKRGTGTAVAIGGATGALATLRNSQNAVAISDAAIGARWDALKPFKASARDLERARIVAYGTGVAAIPFDVMRTKLLYQLRANNWKRVAITSPGVACGKTMTAANLAFSLARQNNIRTMLIELDMRRPSMASVLSIKERHQFADVLGGSAKAEDHMLRHGKNLIIATNHSPTPNPAELLQDTAGAALIDALEEAYKPDVMIFDMPPMLVSDDTMAFLDQVDCGLLIGAAETSTIEEIEKCSLEMASRTNVLGVVLNKCRFMEKAVEYGY